MPIATAIPLGQLGPLGSLASSLTWAIGSTVYAREAERTSAFEVNLARTVVVLPLFLLGVLLTGAEGAGQLGPARLGWLALSTLCSYGVGDVLFYLAATRLGAPTALAIASTFPVWATLAGALTLGERVTPSRAGGTLLCVLGVVWLVLLARGDRAKRAPGQLVAGVLLALGTSLLWAGNTYSVRRGATGLPLLLANAIRYAMSLAVILPAHLLVLARQRRAGVVRPRLLGRGPHLRPFVLICVLEAFFGSLLFVYGLAHSDLGVAAPLSSLAPLFAVPAGLLLGTERLSLRRLLAICVTVAGVVLLVRAA